MNRVKGFFALLACAIIFASFSIFIRLLSTELTNYQQIGFRNVIALVIGIAAVVISKQSFSSLKGISKKHLTAYTLTFPIAVVLFTLSVLEVKIVTTIFGLYLGALLTSLVVGILFFQEKITKMKALSLTLVGLGLISYAYPFNSDFFSLGFVLAVLSGVFDALANSFRKFLSGKVDRFILVVLQMIGGLGVAVALITVFQQPLLPNISAISWLIGLLFGGLLVGISYLTLIGFQNFDLNLGTVILSSELFFASIFALVFFGEVSSFNEIFGGVLVIVATVVANWTIQKDSWLHLRYVQLKKIVS